MTDENEVMIFLSEPVRHQLRIVKAVENKQNYNQTVKMLIDVYNRGKNIEKLTGTKFDNTNKEP